MKSINRAIDRFCYKHPRFGIPNLIKYVVFGTVMVYLLSQMDTTSTLWRYLTFDPYSIMRGQVWRIVSFVFLAEDNNLIFFVISMYFYYMVGGTLERHWGSGKFTIFYLVGMVATILWPTVYWLLLGRASVAYLYIGSYYINLSMLFAFATVYADVPLLLFGILPIKAKWIGILSGASLLYSIFSSRSIFPLNLLPLLALIGYFLFCGGDLIRGIGSLFGRAGGGVHQPINFKKAAKKAERNKSGQSANRKCAVCGKTDVDHPDLEFRYCSRCKGFHCFCIDHINNHVHFDN